MYIGNMSAAFATANCPHVFPGTYGQFLVIGSIRIAPFEGALPFGPLFTTAESMGLDQKIDDGRPASGIMRSLAPAPGSPFENTCATSSDPATAEYTVVGGNECVMGFKLKI